MLVAGAVPVGAVPGVSSCVFSITSYANSKYSGFDKATLDTRGGGETFIGVDY
jgi:hypothetical protein